jgi:UDP-glucose 4-epimerase
VADPHRAGAGLPAAVRVVVVGASGNVGTSVLRSLADEPAVDSVLGIARRVPKQAFPKTEWRQADIARSPLRPLFQGADAVVQLAWLIQPGRDKRQLHAVNVEGSARVFRAAAAAGVPALVYASSIGAYAPGPKDRAVDESWPTTGIETSFYARHKAEVERLLDRFEAEHVDTRVVRMRPGLIFKREAASGIRRLFAGPVMDTTRARTELGWQPKRSSSEALLDRSRGCATARGSTRRRWSRAERARCACANSRAAWDRAEDHRPAARGTFVD